MNSRKLFSILQITSSITLKNLLTIGGQESVIVLMEKFEFENPFENLSLLTEQTDALKEHCRYIDCIECSLDYRLENVFDNETGTYIPLKVYEAYQYVPVIDFLSNVMSNKDSSFIMTI